MSLDHTDPQRPYERAAERRRVIQANLTTGRARVVLSRLCGEAKRLAHDASQKVRGDWRKRGASLKLVALGVLQSGGGMEQNRRRGLAQFRRHG